MRTVRLGALAAVLLVLVACSRVFGIFVSTLLTLMVIPLLYFVLLSRQARRLSPSTCNEVPA